MSTGCADTLTSIDGFPLSPRCKSPRGSFLCCYEGNDFSWESSSRISSSASTRNEPNAAMSAKGRAVSSSTRHLLVRSRRRRQPSVREQVSWPFALLLARCFLDHADSDDYIPRYGRLNALGKDAAPRVGITSNVTPRPSGVVFLAPRNNTGTAPESWMRIAQAT